MKTKSLLIASACLFLSSQTVVVAAPINTTFMSVNFWLGNLDHDTGDKYQVHNSEVNNDDQIEWNYDRVFQGLDSSGNSTEMNLSAEAKGLIENGNLKNYASVTVSNPIFTEDNTPYVLDEEGSIDPDGVPNNFHLSSTVWFWDELYLSATAELSDIQIEFDLTGSMATNYFEGIISLSVNNTSVFWSSSWSESIVDTTVLSNPIAVSDGKAQLSIQLTADIDGVIEKWMQEQFDYMEDPIENFFSTVDFFNTLSIADIIGFDQNGQEVFITNVTGESGTTYISRDAPPVVQVPEPGSLVLIASGFLGLALMRRNRYRVAMKKDLGLI